MAMPAEIRKQWRVAFYSAFFVSLLTTTPVFMMTSVSFGFYPWALLFTTVLTLLMWGMNIGLFYFMKGSRVGRYVWSYVLCATLAVGLMHGLHGEGAFLARGRGFSFHVILFLSVDTVLLIVQDLVVVRERKAMVELENAELRVRNMEVMNQQLKQQIQPHFLFNSLSTLKSLIRLAPADAGEYVVKLAEFLRRSMASPGAAVATVEEEIALCTDYLAMQRMRFGEALQFVVEVDAEVRGRYWLPVFSLQLLVENAIKHNQLTKERPLRIRIMHEGGWIRVENNLQERGNRDGRDGGEGSEPGGLGLVNLRERYRVLGGEEIKVSREAGMFSVSIVLLSNENSDHRG